jgi:hypothetical protein
LKKWPTFSASATAAVNERGDQERRSSSTRARNAAGARAPTIRRTARPSRKKIADDMPGVDELLARAEEEFRLMGCVSKLSDVQQGVVRLIMFEELSGDDVARELGLRPDHVAHAVVPRKEGAVPLPDRLGLTRQPFSSADRASPLSDKIRDHRSRLSSSDVSSILVAIVHTCPDGSMTHPMRSPQN